MQENKCASFEGWLYWNSPGEWPKARAVASAIKQAAVTTSHLNVYVHEVE